MQCTAVQYSANQQLATKNVIEWQRIGVGRNLAGPTTPNGKKRGVEK